MRSVIHHFPLTSTLMNGGRRPHRSSPVRRGFQMQGREKRRTTSLLAARGSLVGSPARNSKKLPRPVEGCLTPGPLRQAARPATAISNEGKPSPKSVRSLERIWLKQHQAEYAGAWVALEGARLLAQGSSALQVLDIATSMGYDQPLVVHVPSEADLPFGGW
jgi:hypothetical protein